MSSTVFFISLGVAVSLSCLILAVSNMISRPKKRIKNRIEAIRKRRHGMVVADQEGSIKKQNADRFKGLESLVRKYLPNQQILEQRLARTGRDISIGAYAMINAMMAFGVFLIAFVLIGSSFMLVLFLALIAGIGLPHLVVGWMTHKRLKLFTAQFPDSIDLIVRGLKSGLPVTESIHSVGQEMADPVGFEFRHIADCVKFGQPLEEALWDTARRLDTPEFKFFVISISVQRETGGNLSEALGNLSEILRRRRQMGLKIKAMSSEAKASAIILGSLPFIMFAIIFAMSPDYEMALFTDPRGQMMLGVGLGFMAAGVLVMNKMVRFEV